MEIKTRGSKLVIAVPVATMCLLLGLLSFAGGSAQTAVGAGDPFPSTAGFEAAGISSTLLETPGSISAAGVGPLAQDGSFEPDDTQDQAKKIIPCERQDRCFEKPGDVDWVKFWAWAGIEYTIRTFDLSDINDTKLWLYDVNGQLAAPPNDDDPDNPPASKIVWTALANGTYFIKVAHPKLQGGDGFSYSLHITDSDPCSDDFEPDDTKDDANEIAVNGMSQYRTFHGPCGGDVDWVKFDAEAGNVYTIRTFSLSGGNDTQLWLYDASCNEVAYNDDDPDNPPASRIDWVATEGGTYFVKAAPFNPFTGGCDLGYYLQVVVSPNAPTPTPTPAPCADEYEPDDILGEAKPIEVNGEPQKNHNFNVPGDKDWAKFWAYAGNEYTIQTFDLSPGNDTVLCLYDTEGRELECNDDISYPDNLASRIIWTAPANGTYFVKARHFSSDVGSCNLKYSLKVTSSIPCRDKYEPDNTKNQAGEITPNGSSQEHNFHVPCVCNCEHPPDEADWVKFNATKDVTYTIRTFDLTGGNDTRLELYDADSWKLDENDDDPDNIPASRIESWTAPADGTYLVKVSPFEPSAGGCEFGYQLEVTIIPGPPCTLTLDAPLSITVGKTSILTATVVDTNMSPVEDGTEVTFETDLGCFETPEGCKVSTIVTTTDGVATAELTCTEVGTATVIATSDPVSDTAVVTFTADVPYTLTLEADPEELTVGETSILTANVVDQYDNNVADGTEVTFKTRPIGCFEIPEGCEDSTTVFTTDGVATAKLTSTEAGTATVTATSGEASDSKSITFNPISIYLPLVLKPPPTPTPTPTPCPCIDIYEPNNNWGERRQFRLESNQPLSSYICEEHVQREPVGIEYDYYYFETTSLSTITVNLTVPNTVNYDLFLWGPGFDDWQRSEDPERGVDERIVYLPTRTGEYVVVVKSLGDADNCNSYTLTATYD